MGLCRICPKVFCPKFSKKRPKSFLSEVFWPKRFDPKVFDFNVGVKAAKCPLFYEGRSGNNWYKGKRDKNLP